MSERKWVKSKFYAIDKANEVLYNKPFKRDERVLPESVLPGAELMWVTGSLLLGLGLHNKYRIIGPGEIPKVCFGCSKVYPVPESVDGLEPSEYVCSKSCADRTAAQ